MVLRRKRTTPRNLTRQTNWQTTYNLSGQALTATLARFGTAGGPERVSTVRNDRSNGRWCSFSCEIDAKRSPRAANVLVIKMR